MAAGGLVSTDAITCQRIKVGDVEHAIVLTAPDRSSISAELLADLALGRGLDADVGDGILWLGVAGHGEGRVCYDVGALVDGAYQLRRRP